MRFTVISLNKPQTVGLILRQMARDADLRRDVFREVARNSKLQREIVAVLAGHVPLHSGFILQLAKNHRLCRKFLRIAGL